MTVGSSTVAGGIIYPPGIHSARPATPLGGAVYPCTTHGTIDRYDPTTGWATWVTIGTGSSVPFEWAVAASDETTALTTGTGKVTFRMPCAMTLTSIRASLTAASSSGLVTVVVKKNGSTVFSTNLTIDATEKTSVTAATPAVLSTTALADDDEITVDITGAGTAAAGLKVTLIGTR